MYLTSPNGPYHQRCSKYMLFCDKNLEEFLDCDNDSKLTINIKVVFLIIMAFKVSHLLVLLTFLQNILYEWRILLRWQYFFNLALLAVQTAHPKLFFLYQNLNQYQIFEIYIWIFARNIGPISCHNEGTFCFLHHNF